MILLTTSHAPFKVILKMAERAAKSLKSLTFRDELFFNLLTIAVFSCDIALNSSCRLVSSAIG